MNFKAPWSNPEDFEEVFLLDVLEQNINAGECNLWDGNVAYISKTIEPHSIKNGRITCLYSGVALRSYPIDHICYIAKK